MSVSKRRLAVCAAALIVSTSALAEQVKTEIADWFQGMFAEYEKAQILERFYSKNNVYTGVTGLSTGNVASSSAVAGVSCCPSVVRSAAFQRETESTV